MGSIGEGRDSEQIIYVFSLYLVFGLYIEFIAVITLYKGLLLFIYYHTVTSTEASDIVVPMFLRTSFWTGNSELGHSDTTG